MKLKITQSINGLLTVREIRTAVTILPFDVGLGAVNLSLIDAVGDLIVGSAVGEADNLPVGVNGQMLTADDSEPLGVKWGPASAITTFVLTNNDGTQHEIGTVVAFDTSADKACKRTTVDGDPKVMAVAAEVVGASEEGLYIHNGQTTVLVQGNVSRGMWLVASATTGRARAAGYQRPTVGGIGIALTAYTGGGAGDVEAIVNVDMYSTSPLVRLATESTGSIASGNSISHTTDPGTDCLIVLCSWNQSTTPTISFNGTGLTNGGSTSGVTYRGGVWYLRNPSIGTYNLTVSGPSANSYVRVYNYAGSQSTPTRTVVSNTATATSSSLDPSSSVGDIVLDMLAVGGTWVTGANQTTETSIAPNYGSKKDGASGTTNMSWSGASGAFCHVAVAIAGS